MVADPFVATTSTAPEACNQSQNFRMLFGATSRVMDVTRAAPGPENEGVAVQLGPNQQVAMQLHVINATSQPILREAWANFRYADPRTVTELADPVQFAAGVFSSIPVGTSVINSGTATVPANAAPDFRLRHAGPAERRVGEERVGGDAIGDLAVLAVEQVRRDDLEVVV